MAQQIKLKRNIQNTTAPTTSDIDVGELAISAVDGKIYLRKTDNAIVAQAVEDDVIALAIALGEEYGKYIQKRCRSSYRYI